MNINKMFVQDHQSLERLQRFLKDNKLPFSDLKLEGNHFAAYQDDSGNIIGYGGLELYGETGLLRSIAVDEKMRGQSLGKKIVDDMIGKAKSSSIKEVYLLTETAHSYFLKKGFEDVSRDVVPEIIKQTTEFAQVRPASAVVMKLKLRQ